MEDVSMKNLSLSLVLALGLSSCVSTDYVGKTYTPTTSVEIFMSEADIAGDYEVMGELIARSDDNVFTSSEKMQNKLLEEAKDKGADGIILGSLERTVTGESSSRTSETKVKAERVSTRETSETTVKEKKELRATLIKFKKH